MPKKKSSPFDTLQNEVAQLPQIRQKLISTLEHEFNAKVITFFTSFIRPAGVIADEDAEMLESILSHEHDDRPLLLVVNSPGGQALAAERIVNVCREYSAGRFEVAVPLAETNLVSNHIYSSSNATTQGSLSSSDQPRVCPGIFRYAYSNGR